MFKKIINFPDYRINEYGQVYSIKTDKFLKPYTSNGNSGTLYVGLQYKGKTKTIQLAKLVLMHFKPSKTKINTYVWHNDLELENCTNDNLERCNRADRLRMFM
jgi:hypothetical protein